MGRTWIEKPTKEATRVASSTAAATPVIDLAAERLARRPVARWHWSTMPFANDVTDADREDGYDYDPEGDGAWMEHMRR